MKRVTMGARVLAAAWVLPVSGPPVADGVVVVDEAGRIAWVGPRVDLPEAYHAAPVRGFPRAMLLPGLVNAHCHLYLTAMIGRLRGRADRFPEWLRGVIAALSAWSPEMPARSTQAGLAVLRTRGVTTVAEMARAPALEAFLASPLRAALFLEVIAFPAARANAALDATRAWLDGIPQLTTHIPYPTSRISAGIAPHAPYTVSAPLARGLAQLARERRLPLAIHLAETEAEREFLATGGGGFESVLRERGAWDESWRPPGVSPVRWAADLGLLEVPGAAVHLNYLSDEDVDLLKAGKLVPVWCPGSHHWFGHRDHPAARLLAAGVPVALGTDSLASNTALDMLAEIKLAARAFPDVPPETWLRAATLTAAEAIGLGEEVGSLAPGKAADLIVLRCESLPPAEPLGALIEERLHLQMAMVAGEEVRIRTESGNA